VNHMNKFVLTNTFIKIYVYHFFFIKIRSQMMEQGPRGSPWEFYPDGPWDGPRSVEGRETRWRGLQAIPNQLSRLTVKARFCNRTMILLL